MILQLCLVSVANIGAGFAVGTVLGRRYRKIVSRREWAALTMALPPVPPAPPPGTPAVAAVRPAAPVAPPATPAVPMPKSPSHLAVDDLHDRVARFGAHLIEADEQLRRCADEPDLGTIESVLSNIEATARNFVESRDSDHQRLADLTRGETQWEGIQNELQIATQMQDAEIKAACQEIANFDYDSNLADGCQKIVGRTHRMLNANDVLRDSLQKALAEVAVQESRPPEEADRSDPLTGCVNRAGIEADLSAWWASVPDHGRLCVAMIDIDRLAEVNEQFGYRVGNEILKAIARLLDTNRTENLKVARFSGQRFLIMFSDVDPVEATNQIERCRQTIDKAHFEYKDFDIRITISCAVTRANADDSPSSVLVRAESALREAKRYGHNRTFVHEGKYPTPVVPPDMSVEELHVPV